MKFRKKPVVIEAFQLAPAGEPVPEGWEDWCGMVNFFDWESDRDEGIAIPTLEGVMRADPGDWIIKGVAGEFYPCKPDIFAATYDNADAPVDMGEVSDGYHTFNELYDHRVRLFSTLMHAYPKRSWFSKLHHDGTAWDGWIIAGIDTPAGTVTYHLPVSEITHLPQGIELTKGKEWDGHTPAMVVDRLLSLRAEQWEGYDVCHVPPEGWKCTRKAGHEGPCAAVPVLPAHQQRVIDERAELEDRHGKLSIFLDAPLFQTLPEEDRALLNEQYIHMTYYLNVLTRRIDRF